MILVICIFDIGKTNKKIFLFDEDYKIRFEKSIELPETKDEDGFPCEDIHALTHWVTETFKEVALLKEFEIKAFNVSAHGASFVHVDETGKPVAPLYNYLKPFPENLKQTFYDTYGGENEFARVTASPVLGNLNSGMQLYWLKHERPDIFKRIKYSLHLPEYISYLFSGKVASGITSIGCHTNLWDFTKNDYHTWVSAESILQKLAPIKPDSHTYKVSINNQTLSVGLGLHDSSAALIPYLQYMKEPFVLLSTGTWSISLNPFNHSELTADELQRDCLCYLTYEGKPVKASRLFAGHWHDEAFKKLTERFHKDEHAYTQVSYNKDLKKSDSTFEAAYHTLIAELISMQKAATDLIMQSTVKNIYVDGGFSKNPLFMNMLAKVYPEVSTYSADLHQASALGAALAIHEVWNTKNKPKQLITLEKVKI
ncbi:MAG: carbohydrate kinase [Cyclobacteriaceae bacterium]|nr:carbohydrate kinase [Cyclobacteriaceae bacterium]